MTISEYRAQIVPREAIVKKTHRLGRGRERGERLSPVAARTPERKETRGAWRGMGKAEGADPMTGGNAGGLQDDA